MTSRSVFADQYRTRGGLAEILAEASLRARSRREADKAEALATRRSITEAAGEPLIIEVPSQCQRFRKEPSTA